MVIRGMVCYCYTNIISDASPPNEATASTNLCLKGQGDERLGLGVVGLVGQAMVVVGLSNLRTTQTLRDSAVPRAQRIETYRRFHTAIFFGKW